MIDREALIKGLKCRLEYRCLDEPCGRSKCPYLHDSRSCYGLEEDALALLQAQEHVKPVVDIDTWKCGNCGHTLEHQELLGDNVLFHEQYNYCPECGRAVKWE